MAQVTFAEKLKLVLKALTMSRTGLAAALNVDKSLVGRWASGSVMPSEHNLANLTRFVATRIDGFTMLDWDRKDAAFARLLGVPEAVSEAGGTWFPPHILEEARRRTQRRGKAYEGLWCSTRASSDLPGRYLHDVTMVRCGEDGFLEFRSGIEGVRYEGRALLLQHQLFSMACDTEHGAVMFGIFNGVARNRADVLDGLSIGTLQDAGGSPACSAMILDRIGDITGDLDEDVQRFETAVAAQAPLAPEGSVPDTVREHLSRAVASESPGLMRMLFAHSMARGPLLEPGEAG
ncbi:helix-turn-helix domain-containing protein [Hyphobacterium marinum]|uniref:Helix-turn-helix transcriptional regulator n=1 Tax=Hyphobacterium marinum TaxID=3116574 RepID=A0ABU7LXA3_9PROT|nr:helix-turn-helix transcriptional regulator [Hyphobacterium sp. Y6023]MEE2566101.1 helix-turn-helix transcriptional regulator [Hyphobacterium sp. Y6023]